MNINIWYTAGVLDWGSTELKKMDVKTRKTMTMHGAFHRKSDVDRLYMKRKHGGRGLISVVDCVRIEEENLLEYTTKSNEWIAANGGPAGGGQRDSAGSGVQEEGGTGAEGSADG